MKGNAHLLNASVAKRMRELRLDVAGRLYTQALAPYNKLPGAMELGIHARNALKAAEVLLQSEHGRPLPDEATRGAVTKLAGYWSLLRDELLTTELSPTARSLTHDMSNALQSLLVIAKGSKPE